MSKTLLNFNKLCTKIRYNHTWIQPEGYDTGIKVYNCVAKKKVPLIVKNKHFTTWYTCGPTVYDTSHIGHACCYTKLDIIQNILREYFKIDLITVMNITDIDDKILNKSLEKKEPFNNVSKQYEKEFWIDINALKVKKPDIVLRVTDNIDLVIEFIKTLVDDNKAYIGKDNSVYFDIKTCDNYGKLQNLGEDKKESREERIKRNSHDFALWKASKPNEPFWESPWGSGRPGWHIECSALATHALGSNIDIHAGGIDLRFPHHENEEAQSCAYHQNNQWVNYWLHTGHLHLKDSEKMSKSLKNTISITDLLKTVSPDVFRMACAMSHYRSQMEYSTEFMQTASNNLNVYKNFLVKCEEFKKGILKSSVNQDILQKLIFESNENIQKSLCDDFDTPNVIKTMNTIVSTVNNMLHSSAGSYSTSDLSNVTALSNILANTLALFNIDLTDSNVSKNDEDFTEVMDILNCFRQDVRNLGIVTKNQDILKLCDRVRDDLKNTGIVVKDYGKVSSWSK